MVWAGTEPSALFRSDDGGAPSTWSAALWDHPHRPQWGAGFGGQAVHTVLPAPAPTRTVLVAMSTGGVYRTDDGGETWEPGNTGIKAYFMPDPWPEFGQCVHKVARDAGRPDRLFAQNHHGVYRTDDGGATWKSIADGLPTDFGFPIVAHPRRPDTVYELPARGRRRAVPARGSAAGSTARATPATTLGGAGPGLPDGPFYAGGAARRDVRRRRRPGRGLLRHAAGRHGPAEQRPRGLRDLRGGRGEPGMLSRQG